MSDGPNGEDAVVSRIVDDASQAIMVATSDSEDPERATFEQVQSPLQINFGPSRSPQPDTGKRPVPTSQTPIRKSQRLSSPIHGRRGRHSRASKSPGPHIPSQAPSSEEDEFQHEGILVDISEEPSSALAVRVIRAWDNPSPPPSPPLVPSADLLEIFDTDTPTNLSGSVTPVPEIIENNQSLDDTHASGDETPSEPPLAPFQDNPLTAQSNSESDLNLITFDSFASAPIPDPHASVPLLPQSATDSVDALLSQSPNIRLPMLHSMTAGVITPLPSAQLIVSPELALTPPMEEEQEVANNLLLPPTDHILSPPLDGSAQPSSTRTSPVQSIPLNVEPIQPVAVRRSSRRSQTPLRVPTPLVSTSSPKRHALDPSLVTLQSQEGGALEMTDNKSRKGKEREVPVGPINSEEGLADHVISEEIVNEEGARRQSPAPGNGPTSKTKRKSRRKPTGFVRELGSLSPSSANVLKQLIPATTPPRSDSPKNANLVEDPVARVATPVQLAPQPSLLPTTPEHISPVKPTDLTRTPRRVPIAEAIAQGTFSPEKGFLLFGNKPGNSSIPPAEQFGPSVFKRISFDSPNRSPARRVPIGDTSNPPLSPSKGKVPSLSGSLKPVFPRSRSEEPRQSNGRVKGRSASLEPSSKAYPSTLGADGNGPNRNPGPSEAGASRSTSLPLPIRAAIPSSTPTIPEDEEENQGPQAPPSPSKASYLKRASASADSRIPRIGAKPYARPSTSTVAENKPSTKRLNLLVKPAKRSTVLSTPSVAPPIRTIRKATGKAKLIPQDPNGSGPGPATLAIRPTTVSQPSTATTLKRKRGEEPKVLPSDTKAPMTFRKVPSSKAPAKTLSGLPSSPMKPAVVAAPSQISSNPHPMTQMRKVVAAPRLKDDAQTENQDQGPPTHTPVSDTGTVPHPKQAPTPSSAPSPPQQEDPFLLPVPTPALPPAVADSQPPLVVAIVEPSQDPPEPSLEIDAVPQREVRRTTRNRKPPQGHAEPFKPAPRSRRKAPAPPVDDGFGGLTALALRSLTTSNTTRNQKQIVELTTEVVRIDGARPDSPTTKVRTILERQKELKSIQRQERAERRRKIAEGLLEEDENGLDGVSEVDDESMVQGEQDENGLSLRHRLGPGEDEEYITPPRPPKRGRFGDDQEVQDEKRVKWEYGLSTIVYFDSSSPKPRRSTREDVIKKGCLTPAAKMARLDNMGNVLDASVPLLDLVHENVIVKKFVYDDDIDALPPPPTKPRTTRSKAKKSKT